MKFGLNAILHSSNCRQIAGLPTLNIRAYYVALYICSHLIIYLFRDWKTLVFDYKK